MTDSSERPTDRAGGTPAGREAPEGAAASDGAGPDDELPNLAVRVVWLIVAPARLFDRLRDRPAWVDALLLAVAVSLAGALLLPEELIREAIRAQMPADAPPEAAERAMRLGRLLGWVGSVVGPALSAAAISGLLLFVYNVVLGDRATFRQLFSVSTHALLLPVIGGLLTLPLMLSTGDIQTSLALHLLVPGLDSGSYAHRFLRRLNVFGLWCAVLLAIGVSRVYPKRSAGAAAALLLGLYVGIKAGLALTGF